MKQSLTRVLRSRWVAVAAILAVTGATVVTTSGAGVARPDDRIRVDSLHAETFTGTVEVDGPTGESIPECAATNCDHIAMKVDLPRLVWLRPGGVQVTVSWAEMHTGEPSLFNDVIQMYVYKDGVQVGVSDPFVTTFQSVRLNHANPRSTPNGTYDIYLAYAGYPTDAGVPPSPVIKYKGWAQVQHEVPRFPTRDLLPNLVPILPQIATFDHPPAIFGDEPALDTIGCFVSERDEQGATKCLRIEQRMWNQNGRNAGALEIRFTKAPGEFPATIPVFQRIYRSNGTFFDRPAGTVDLHPIHGHYHYTAYTQTSVYARGANGLAVGPPLGVGLKNGFCLADTDQISGPSQYVEPMVYSAPNCLEPRNPGGNPEQFIEGQGTGNGDTYGWDLPDQYVPAEGLGNGTFIVQTVLDPDHKLLEANVSDNCIAVALTLSGMGTSAPTATLGTQQLSCAV